MHTLAPDLGHHTSIVTLTLVLATVNEIFSFREISSRGALITIFIAYRLSAVVHANRIIVLEKGRVVELGSRSALMAARVRYYAMRHQQVGEMSVDPQRSALAALNSATIV